MTAPGPAAPPACPRRAALALGGTLLALTAPAHAVLDLRPFAGATYEQDDNVYRFANAEEAMAQRGSPTLDDTLRRIAIGSWAQFDYGRQTVRAFGELRHFDYGEFAELERTEGAFEGRYDWSYSIPWSGHLLYEHARKLEPVTSTETADLGFQTLQETELFVGHALTPRWRAEGGVGARRKRHTRAEAENSDLDEARSRFGFSWASAIGTAGTGVELTRGRFPHREAAPGSGVVTKYWQTDYLVRASNAVSGASTFETEFGYTRRSGPPGEAFGGMTGRLRYLWRWTRRTTVDTQGFRRLRDIEERNANYVDELGVAMEVQHSLMRTIGLFGKAHYATQDYAGSPAIASEDGVARADTVNRFELGLSYSPRPWIAVKPAFGQEQRTSTQADREYDSTVASVTLEVRSD